MLTIVAFVGLVALAVLATKDRKKADRAIAALEQKQADRRARRETEEGQALVDAGLREARLDERRRAELRQTVREEVAAHFARQEPEPIGSWRDSGRD